jgi:hypothetical protein
VHRHTTNSPIVYGDFLVDSILNVVSGWCYLVLNDQAGLVNIAILATNDVITLTVTVFSREYRLPPTSGFTESSLTRVRNNITRALSKRSI